MPAAYTAAAISRSPLEPSSRSTATRTLPAVGEGFWGGTQRVRVWVWGGWVGHAGS
jgi:hypothetical protein